MRPEIVRSSLLVAVIHGESAHLESLDTCQGSWLDLPLRSFTRFPHLRSLNQFLLLQVSY